MQEADLSFFEIALILDLPQLMSGNRPTDLYDYILVLIK